MLLENLAIPLETELVAINTALTGHTNKLTTPLENCLGKSFPPYRIL